MSCGFQQQVYWPYNRGLVEWCLPSNNVIYLSAMSFSSPFPHIKLLLRGKIPFSLQAAATLLVATIFYGIKLNNII